MKTYLHLCLLALTGCLTALAQPHVTAWEVLNAGLTDKSPDRRQQAVTAIGSIGLDPDAIKGVERGLRDDDPTVRQTAAAQLGQMKSVASIPALKAALDDPSGEVAFTAARVLWQLGNHNGEQTLQDVLTRQLKSSDGALDGAMRDAKKKLHSPKALAIMGAKEASGALLGPFSIGITAVQEFAKDSGATGRALAATMLAQSCDARNKQLLEWSLKEEKSNVVRAAIAKSLGACGDKDEIPRLEQYLSNGHDAVRFMSAAAIIRLTGPQPAAR